MKIKNLLLAALTLPLLFVACNENPPVDEVKAPTVVVTPGQATVDSVTFTITSTDADNAAWLIIEASETAPTASEVLVNGNAVEANKSVECKAENLNENTEYTIVAAVKNSKGVDKREIKMTTLATTPDAPRLELTSDAEVEFSAEGGEGTITYTLENAIEGTELTATCEADWITDIAIADNITFTVAANDGEAREAVITVSYGDVSSFEVKVKQAAKSETPQPEVDVEFNASFIDIGYYGLQGSAYNYYVQLSDVGLTDGGYFKQNGTYYLLDFYSNVAASEQGGTIPNGTYTITDSGSAGTVGTGTYGANVVVVEGVPTYNLYVEGNVVVTDGKIVADIVMENGEIHRAVYEGDLSFGNGSNTGGGEFEATHTATSWIWGGASSYGNKYAVAGEGFSLDVHFPVDFATEDSLAEGEYIWTSTSWWGYNDFENEFTTRSFAVDGVTVAVDAGSALVATEGSEYHIELTLVGRDGYTYMIEYNGTLSNNSQGGGEDSDAVVFTYCELPTYNSAYYFYEFKFSNEKGDKLSLCVNDYQANSSMIYSDDTYEWISIGYCGNLGYFSTRDISVDGTSYTAASGSMVVVTDETTQHMDITITLLTTTSGKKVFKFSGIAGQDSGNEGGDNTGNEGGDNTGNEGGDNTGNEGGDNTGNEGGETTESFENWVFSASLDMDSLLVTLTDGSHTVTCTLNQLSGGIFYLNGNGVLNVTDIKVNGVAAESASGTLEISTNQNYHIILDAEINGVKYTGTSTNPVV